MLRCMIAKRGSTSVITAGTFTGLLLAAAPAIASAEVSSPANEFDTRYLLQATTDGQTATVSDAPSAGDSWWERFKEGRDFYVRGTGGYVFSHNFDASANTTTSSTSQRVDIDSTGGLFLAAGYNTDYDDISGRFELELSYLSGSGTTDFTDIQPNPNQNPLNPNDDFLFDSGSADTDVTHVNVMVNAYAHAGEPDRTWRPYIGAGVGFNYFDIEDDNFGSRDGFGPTFQFLGGVEYLINDQFRATAGARYWVAWHDDDTLANSYFIDAVIAEIGLVYKF